MFLGQKKEEEIFDLERDLEDSGKFRQMKKEVDTKIQVLKKILREGSEEQEEFNKAGTLLHAYTALQKLMVRVGTKKN